MTVHEGDRLSELTGQDSYSYIIANIYVGAADESELTEKIPAVRPSPAIRNRR